MLDLQQDGNRVTGTYPLYGGRIEAEVRGRELHGRWIEGDRFGTIIFVMAEDGASFVGRFDTGEWWTGGRMASSARRIPVDQATPRRAMRTFLTGYNRTRLRDEEAWGAAVAVVDFGEEGARLRSGQKIARVRALAEAINLATFRLWSIPGRSADGDAVRVSLVRAGTDAAIDLEFRRNGGRWFIVMPTPDDLAAKMRSLRDARAAAEASGSHFALRSPRDVFLTLFDPEASEGQRLAIFDLSGLPESVKAHEGRLAIEYLRQVLARIGPVLPQEVPDDPAWPRNYVHFEHPLGRVAVARLGDPGPTARWAVTAETLASLRTLWTALEAMPPDAEAAQALQEPTGYFAIRRWIGLNAPSMLLLLGPLEAWQVAGTLFIVALGWMIGLLAGWPATLAFSWLARIPPADARMIRWPARLAAASGLWLWGSHWLGLPNLVEGTLLGLFSITLAAAAAWGGWCVVDAMMRRLTAIAMRTATQVDEIMVSLLAGAAKVALMVGATVYVALTLHIPVAGIVAGLGVGGLAFAFASRETLQNVFGAGILLADRPFKRGDSIIAGDVRGIVEGVGIRSTRVRSSEDSIIVVPNGKLADATINNLGTRRYRVTTGKIALGWTSTSEQVDALIGGLREILDARGDVVRDKTQAGATGFGADGMEVEFTAFLTVANLTEERAVKHEILREVLALAHRLKLPVCDDRLQLRG